MAPSAKDDQWWPAPPHPTAYVAQCPLAAGRAVAILARRTIVAQRTLRTRWPVISIARFIYPVARAVLPTRTPLHIRADVHADGCRRLRFDHNVKVVIGIWFRRRRARGRSAIDLTDLTIALLAPLWRRRPAHIDAALDILCIVILARLPGVAPSSRRTPPFPRLRLWSYFTWRLAVPIRGRLTTSRGSWGAA